MSKHFIMQFSFLHNILHDFACVQYNNLYWCISEKSEELSTRAGSIIDTYYEPEIETAFNDFNFTMLHQTIKGSR